MGFEPTTASLEGWNSTTELRPPTVNLPTLQALSRHPSENKPSRCHIPKLHDHHSAICHTQILSRYNWWAGKDSNLGSHKAADLQSAPFVHLGTCPSVI